MVRRRRVPRREFQRRIGVLVKGRYHVSRCVQIGEGGIMIYSADNLSVGQRVVLSFKLPGQAPTVVSAAVRYILPEQLGIKERYGLEFINLNFEVKREIRNYVAMQNPIADDVKPSA